MSDLYVRAKAIAMAALSQPAATRQSWLANQCGENLALLHEARWLLDSADLDSDHGQVLVPGAPQPPPMTPLVAGTAIDASQPGQYRVVRLLGEGGMGMVYLAERLDGDSRQFVALKLISGGTGPGIRSAQLAVRLSEERRILAMLHHPNIAHLVDGGVTADGQPFIAMEYIEGERIDLWCERNALTLRERLKLFIKVCAAVEHAHQRLVIHRDLKPANILIDTQGEPKLLDFGIARLVEDATGNADPTRTMHRALTLAYASPEHVEGQPLTTATDIWSLGILLYELLTGVRPHQSAESGHLLPSLIVSGDIRPPSNSPLTGNLACDAHAKNIAKTVGRISADIDAIVLKALRRDPSQRYASVASLSGDIRRFLESKPVSARKGHAFYRLKRFAYRHRWRLGALAVVLLALSGYLVEREQQLRTVTAERNKSLALSSFMTDLFSNADPSHSRGEKVTVKEVLDRGSAKIGNRTDINDEMRADLMLTMAQSYVGLDLLKSALPISQEALRLKQKQNAPLTEVASVLEQISSIHANLGENAKAIEIARDGLALVSRDNPDQFTIWAKLKVMELRSLDLQGNMSPEELIPALRDLLAELDAQPQAKLASARVNVLESLANTLLRTNNTEDAVRYQEQAVAIATSQLQHAPESVLATRGNLGTILISIENAKRGVPILEAADRDYVKLIGEDAGSRASLLNDLSAGYKQLGDYVTSAQYAQKAVDVAKQSLGTDNRLYLQMAVSLAISFSDESQYAKAEALLREVMPHLAARSGPGVDAANHAYALAALSHLLLDTSGNTKEALRLAEEAEKVVLPHASGNVLVVYNNAIRAQVRAHRQLQDMPGASAAIIRFETLLDKLQEPASSSLRANTKTMREAISQ